MIGAGVRSSGCDGLDNEELESSRKPMVTVQ